METLVVYLYRNPHSALGEGEDDEVWTLTWSRPVDDVLKMLEPEGEIIPLPPGQEEKKYKITSVHTRVTPRGNVLVPADNAVLVVVTDSNDG
jgi:hypothetical protein